MLDDELELEELFELEPCSVDKEDSGTDDCSICDEDEEGVSATCVLEDGCSVMTAGASLEIAGASSTNCSLELELLLWIELDFLELELAFFELLDDELWLEFVDIPNASYVIRGDVQEDLKQAIEDAYLSFDDSEYFETIYGDAETRFTTIDDEYYTPAIEAMAITGGESEE